MSVIDFFKQMIYMIPKRIGYISTIQMSTLYYIIRNKNHVDKFCCTMGIQERKTSRTHKQMLMKKNVSGCIHFGGTMN